AFAVAAHLECENLLVDEVLAVGDAAFQRRCLGKMSEVAQEGRIVVFVSHHMPSLTRLCRRALWLDAGAVVLDGDATAVTSRYLHSDRGTAAERRWENPAHAPGDPVARLRAVRVLQHGQVADSVDIRSPVVVEMEYTNFLPGHRLLHAFTFLNDQGVILFASAPFAEDCKEAQPQCVGLIRARCTVPGNLLAEGWVRVVAEV